MISAFPGVLLFGVLLGCCLWVAYSCAAWLLDGRPSVSARMAATVVSALWLLAAIFQATISVSAFDRLTVSVTWLLLTAVTVLHPRIRSGTWNALLSDARRLMALSRKLLRQRVSLFLLLPVLTVGYRSVIGLYEPPSTWDALTYHLLKAGRWVQQGDLAAEVAPNAWGYYEYFPPVGDCYWAWAMLPASDDGMLVLANLLIWLAGVLAAYALARQLRAVRMAAAAAAIVVGFTPAVYNRIFSSYVDNLLLAVLLAALLFFLRAWKRPRLQDSVLLFAALGVALATKLNAAVFVALAVPAICLRSALRERRREKLLLRVAAGLMPLLLAVPPMVRAWMERGSPFYPVPAAVAGLALPGNEQLAWLLAGRPQSSGGPVGEVVEILPTLWGVCFGFGPGATLVLGAGAFPLALFAGLKLFAGRRDLPIRITVVVFVLLLTVPLLSDDMVAYRQLWKTSLPRLITPAYAVLAVWCAARGGPWGFALLLFAVQFSAFHLVWGNWSSLVSNCLLQNLPVLILFAAAGAAGAFVLRHRPRHRTVWLVSCALAGAVVFLVQAQSLRREFRYDFYRELSEHGTYADKLLCGHWPIWKEVDRETPMRIAAVSGWDSSGLNIYRYPLLGSRFQNHVTYVANTVDGTVSDYRSLDQQKALGNYESWFKRLREQRIDAVVTYDPPPLEALWMDGRPELFELAGQGEHGRGRVYRLRRQPE